MTKKKLSANEVAYLKGLFAAFEDFSDGAWQCACQEAIAQDKQFKGRDAYEVWIAYVEATFTEKKPKGAT